MELAVLLKIIALGLIHWALAPIALKSLVERRRVLGPKGLWVLSILFVTCFGSLFYLIIHELLPEVQTQVEYND